MHQPQASIGRTEARGDATGTSTGTTVTASASTNTKGTWVDLGAATTFAYEAVTLDLGVNSAAADYMVDIGISDGSNRFVLIADIHFAAAKTASEHGCQIYIPVHVPAGAQVSARLASSTGSATAAVIVHGHETGLAGTPGFSRCVALFTPATSRGIAIDPGGTANTKGTYAQITASCPNDIGAMFGLIGYNGDVARTAEAAALIDIALGAAASEQVLYPNAVVKWSATRDGPTNCPRIPLFACNVSATTRIAARAQCSDNVAGDRTVDLALYGLVP
jgi:hypothetical protein